LFPGPTIHLTEGDRVSIKVTNLVAENVTIHW
jgi:laccase